MELTPEQAELVERLVARGHEGVAVGEWAAELAAREGREWTSDEDVVRAGRMLLALRHWGAVLDVGEAMGAVLNWGEFYRPSEALETRVRLLRWSGLPPECRQLPTEEELAIDDPVDLLAAWLLAGGLSGQDDGSLAAWTARAPWHGDPERDVFFVDPRARAIAALEERGWEIVAWSEGIIGGPYHYLVVSTPDFPARAPADIPPAPRLLRHDWPRHAWRLTPDLHQAIVEASEEAARRFPGRVGVRWFQPGWAPNPQPGHGSPAWFGQPLPTAEEQRQRLIAWAQQVGAEQVLQLARPGAIERVDLDEPVGLVEIAHRLGVVRDTADKWRVRGELPPPDFTVGGRPAWRWATIEAWARRTGRLR